MGVCFSDDQKYTDYFGKGKLVKIGSTEVLKNFNKSEYEMSIDLEDKHQIHESLLLLMVSWYSEHLKVQNFKKMQSYRVSIFKKLKKKYNTLENKNSFEKAQGKPNIQKRNFFN